ncbi:MAG: PSD1 and planctomycete cytochrome C domain-containing protein [Verrucomicrobia bacterium]|nr:PSD1 and planctomycete cytochrome C domain-containing protein [Verrucomicrobiota bacterium]
MKFTTSPIVLLPRSTGANILLPALTGLLFLSALMSAAEPDAKLPPADVYAVLEAHCVKCHGGENTKGGLDLVTREALLRGGESGAAVVLGKPDASLLIRQVRHEEDPHMPHKEPKLPDAAIAQLVAWVKDGAPYTRALAKTPQTGAGKDAAKFAVTDADRSHWSFQPIRRPTPPTLQNPKSDIQNPIDLFVLAKLEAAGLSLSPAAGKATLIRRATLDLIGLPPTPAEIDAFVNDTSPQAYERLLDRLLASPHYGERWGRHWLDLARFAETDGFEHDAVRQHSWRYRDYVVKSFTDDKPYDRFIREQIAGDELWPSDAEALTATGFNLLGPDMVDSSDQIQRRHNTLNDMTDTAALAFLGLTMGCARCHDHKFEPISQRDYYAVQAFFTPAKFVRDTPVPTPESRVVFEVAMKKYSENPKVRELAELDAPVRARLSEKKVAKLAPEAQVAHRTPPEKRDAEQANLVLETEDKVKVSDKDIAAAVTGAERDRRQALLDEVKKLPKPPELPKAMTLARGDASAKTFLLNRGEYSQPQEEVAPGFPTVLNVGQASSLSPPANEDAPVDKASGNRSAKSRNPAQLSRAALADWIASPKNSLTARVMVNRIWQHHFGRGLVVTPSDFGTHGAKPTHPELLDWLASEFIARGWSVKQMHKLMMMSETYRQSANADSSSTTSRSMDPDNRLLWRMNRLRLEGEAIRDCLLAISGQLNPELGGPGVFPPIPKEVTAGAKGGWPQNDRARDYSRRSIYIFARRNLRFPFLEVFDAPDNNLSCPARERSTTAPQSLTLLNADDVIVAAKLTAARLMKESDSNDGRITLGYRLALGRSPNAKEQQLARDFLAHAPLHEFCRALFNLNDFVYAE